jgi:hypothetical protein
MFNRRGPDLSICMDTQHPLQMQRPIIGVQGYVPLGFDNLRSLKWFWVSKRGLHPLDPPSRGCRQIWIECTLHIPKGKQAAKECSQEVNLSKGWYSLNFPASNLTLVFSHQGNKGEIGCWKIQAIDMIMYVTIHLTSPFYQS